MERPNIFRVVIFIATLYIIIDVVLNEIHLRENGPYTETDAEILAFNASCELRGRDVVHVYRLKVNLNEKIVESDRPFIGLYPLRICFLSRFYTLYDREKFNKFKRGEIVRIIIDKGGRIYLGKTDAIFNYLVLGFLFILLLLTIRWSRKHKDD